MDPLPAFALTLLAISVIGIRFRIAPFFTLVGGALFYGILTGLAPDRLITVMTAGLGKVFGLFAIVILSGAVIAKILEEQGQVAEIVADIRGWIRTPATLSGLSGFLLALPVACSITAFIILEPIIRNLGKDESCRTLLILAAIGSLLSFGLIYPTPATIPLVEALLTGISPLVYDAVAIALSLILLAGVLVLSRRTAACMLPDEAAAPPAGSAPRFHIRAWAPFAAILLAVPAGAALGLSTGSLIQVIMLTGAVTALLLASPSARMSGLHRGAKHAGLIIFDICGAGALAAVILESGFAGAALGGITMVAPLLAAPFLLAALLQTAQGSRVVTAVITAEILAGTPAAATIHPVTLVLMVVAGTFVFSYVTDPYFWIVKHATGSGIPAMIRGYTLPLAACGLITFLVALGLQTILA
ncbi:MAG: GntP family permease [Methanomicrobiales archaeon]|nr:GntP family permease [Methanomicrobiales archaeon]NYT21892.1 GntP family permease [Methanomicrobiales archaeon]